MHCPLGRANLCDVDIFRTITAPDFNLREGKAIFILQRALSLENLQSLWETFEGAPRPRPWHRRLMPPLAFVLFHALMNRMVTSHLLLDLNIVLYNDELDPQVTT